MFHYRRILNASIALPNLIKERATRNNNMAFQALRMPATSGANQIGEEEIFAPPPPRRRSIKKARSLRLLLLNFGGFRIIAELLPKKRA